MQTTRWNSLSIDTPEDWELLLFSKSRDAGSLTFADRTAYRLQVRWQTLKGEPDFTRMLEDAGSRMESEDSGWKVTSDKRFGWSGLIAEKAGGCQLHYLSFARRRNLLIEAIFPYPCPDLDETVDKVLQGLEARRLDGLDREQWIAFGMNFTTKFPSRLTGATVRPAFVQLDFAEHPESAEWEQFSRLGMVDRWLQGNLDRWLESRQVDPLQNPEAGSFSRDGYSVVWRGGSVPRKGIRKIRGAAIEEWAAAWRDLSDGRIYLYRTRFSSVHRADMRWVDFSTPDRMPLCSSFQPVVQGGLS